MEEVAHLPDQYHPPYSLQRYQHMTSQHSGQQQMVWKCRQLERQLSSVVLYEHECQTFTLYSNIKMILFTSDPGGCCWSWGGSQAGRRTLGSALWHPPCCPWRLTPTPSLRYKTSALGCRSLPEQRWDTTPSHLQCTDVWNFATGLLIINILCLIYCSHLNIILFPDVCRKLICCHLKGAFHLLIKFHNLQWKSLERQCNLN